MLYYRTQNNILVFHITQNILECPIETPAHPPMSSGQCVIRYTVHHTFDYVLVTVYTTPLTM